MVYRPKSRTVLRVPTWAYRPCRLRVEARRPAGPATRSGTRRVQRDQYEPFGVRYAYRFSGQAVTTVSRALPCGDCWVVMGGRFVAVVERKSHPSPREQRDKREAPLRRRRPGGCARAAVVVEDRYSVLSKYCHAVQLRSRTPFV